MMRLKMAITYYKQSKIGNSFQKCNLATVSHYCVFPCMVWSRALHGYKNSYPPSTERIENRIHFSLQVPGYIIWISAGYISRYPLDDYIPHFFAV